MSDRISGRAPHVTLPDELSAALERRFDLAARERVAERVWSRDDTLWGAPGQAEVADRLGWLDVHDRLAEHADELFATCRNARDDGLRDVVVLGMGGSSLAPEVFRRSFGEREDALRLHVLDSTDTQAIRDLEAVTDRDHTLYIASSKSGGTIETLSALHHFWERTGEAGDRFCAITDPGTSLETLARERDFRHVFLGDPEIGGRYSALSPFGIVPAAFAGADVAALLAGGSSVAAACRDQDPRTNPGVFLGIVIGEMALAGRDKLTFVVDEPVAAFGLWVEQLIAESLGKDGKGILPVAGEPVGAAADYGPDRLIVHVRGPGAENDDAVARLTAAGVPAITMEVEGAVDLGALMLLWEMATAVCGWVLAVNPFNQPDVQSAKDRTKEVLAGTPPVIAPASEDALKALLTGEPPSYLAIQAFTAPDSAVDAVAAELRAAIRGATRMATTFGYGPRYLHSTGQLHKGGPPTGRFLQLVGTSAPDIETGNEAGSFERLKRAQADGDLLVLREHGLPAERILLGDDAAATIREITGRL